VTVLIVDDHPALRAGLEGLLEQEPGVVPLGAVADQRSLMAELARRRPDVVILDYVLERGDGLSACFRIKQRPDPPGVVLYSAYVDPVFAAPAMLAQADAVVSKSAPVEELLAAVHAVAGGERLMPVLEPDAMEAASSRLTAEELPVAGMLFARLTVDEIAATLGLDVVAVRATALRIIGELQARDRLAHA
jgi:DNA-binding NarL/FixJ family response regulator